jgi:hypothetical protein
LYPFTGLNRTMVVAIVSSACAVSACLSAEPASWKAGVAKESITPREPVWMAGFAARNGPSDGQLTELYARALALSDAQNNRLVVVTLDLIEIPEALRDMIAGLARKSHGLKPEELLVNVSHTHGGPMVSSKTVAEWGLDPVWGKRADDYVAFLLKRINAVIGNAISSQSPATVGYAGARCDVAMNRRLPTAEGVRLAPNPDGPVDHDVPILRIESAEKKLVGLVFGYACHNTAMGPTRQLNGDYAGFAQQKLEKDHPDTVAIFLSGCGGDQNPARRRNEEDAVQNGLALAKAVESGLAATPIVLDASLAIRLATCPLAFAPLPPRAELEARANSPDGYVSRHARWVLREWPNPGDQPADYPLPIQVVELGGKLTLVALGGEPVVDYSIRLKRELAAEGQSVWVAGYSNLVHAYVPTRRVLQEGGYEGTEAVIYQALPGPFRMDIEDRIVDCIRREVAAVRTKRQAP